LTGRFEAVRQAARVPGHDVYEAGWMPSRIQRRRRERGFSYIEMLVTAGVLLILASAVIPLTRWDDKRRRENRLRVTLHQMRQAIDEYHRYVEEGLIIQSDVEQMGYPLTLEELVEGVEVNDPMSPEVMTIRFLQRMPVDPFTEEAEWGLRSYQDDWDSSSWGGQNVYDVYSLSPLRALDGTYYEDW
jgi:general secretion pathway protein G